MPRPLVVKDGRRYGDGVRFASEAEADAYRAFAVNDLRKLIVTKTIVIRSDDEPTAWMRGRNLGFMDGTCGQFGWRKISARGSRARL